MAFTMYSFNPRAYGAEVESILALDGGGVRPMPLVASGCTVPAAAEALATKTARGLLPAAAHPEAAFAGLWLYFSCFDEAHRVAQDIDTAEGSFWHAIAHRREPDAANSGYWFRRTGRHAIFAELRRAAAERQGAETLLAMGVDWDPFAFIDFCERARRRRGSEEERLALELQLAEWQLLFDYCARPAR